MDIQCNGGGSDGAASVDLTTTSLGGLSLNMRYTLEFFYDMTRNKVKLWVNGVEVSPAGGISKNYYPSDGSLSIGYSTHSSTGSPYFGGNSPTGTIHEVSVYDCKPPPEPFTDRAALKTAVDTCISNVVTGVGATCCSTDPACTDRSSTTYRCGAAACTDMPDWDVSLVTDMSVLFMNYPVYEQFNADISKWDVSSVTTMYRMFQNCKSFDQDISAWDISSLTSMEGMFLYAETFNADISGWATGGVLNMRSVFNGAETFNQPIGSWDVSQATSMFQMFYNARAFNQDLSSWDVSNVEDMRSMFGQAYAFNQDIGSWNTAKVTNMQSMFFQARAFNQDIRSWNTALVTTMLQMFDGARAFNQDITGWNTASLTVYGDMFTQANAWLAAFDRLDETESTAGPPNEWTALVPCDPSGPIANGAPGPGCTSTLADGSSCTPTCNTGYTLSGTRSCTAGTLTDTAVCNGNSCDASGPISNGAAGSGCTATLADGATCTLTCNSGYTLSGSRSCSAGTFTDTAVCSGDSCDASNAITNGVLNDCTSTLADGTACTPTCNTGYTLSGTRSCTAGTLTDTAVCNPDPCDASIAISNGASGPSCTATLADGATCTPTCNTGYTLSGARSCSSGTLTDTAVCNGNSCDASGAVGNGALNDCSSTLAHGAACTPTCNTGYTLSGTRSCTAGALTDTVVCNPDPCDASGAISNGAAGSGCTSTLAHGSSCTPTCNSGYTLSGTRSCSAGTLTDTSVCNGNSCDASGAVANGALNDCTSTLAHGASCTPTCNTGYTRSGTRSCAAGTLTNTVVCNPDPCTLEENDDSKNGDDGVFYCINGGTVSGTTGSCLCTGCDGFGGASCETAGSCSTSNDPDKDGSDGSFWCINGGIVGGTAGDVHVHMPGRVGRVKLRDSQSVHCL